MYKNKLQINDYSSEEIKKLINSNNCYKKGLKLFAIYLFSKGWSARKLESLFDISFKQITIWIHYFNLEGEASLNDKPKTGRKPGLTNEQKEELKKIILTQKPEEFDIEEKRWNGRNITLLVKNHFNVNYQKAQIYNIIKSLKIKYENGLWKV